MSEFLDDIYGSMSKMPREDYMKAVQSKQSWIFSSAEIRKRMHESSYFK